MEKAAEFLDGFFDRIVDPEMFEEFYSESFFVSLIEGIRQSLESNWKISVTGRLIHLLQFATVDQITTEKFLLVQKEEILDLILKFLKFFLNFLKNFEIFDENFFHFFHWIFFISCLRIVFSIGNAEKNRKNPQIQEIFSFFDQIQNRFRFWKEKNQKKFDKNDALEIEMQTFYHFMQKCQSVE